MKAVLVIDMPNRCSECPLCSKDENYWGDIVSAECQMQYKGYLTLNEMEKPIWCPLKPMPLKGTMENVDECEYNRGFVDGRNHCIELITGENE